MFYTVLSSIKNLIVIILNGILLIPILILTLVSDKLRVIIWKKINKRTDTYNTLPNNRIDQLFSLCVNFLLILGEKVGMSYNEINIWIFCIIWPILTLILFILAIC